MDSQGGEGRGGAGWALCAEVALVRGVSLLRIELRPAEENQEGLGPASNAAGRFCPHTRHERVPGGSAAQRGKNKKQKKKRRVAAGEGAASGGRSGYGLVHTWTRGLHSGVKGLLSEVEEGAAGECRMPSADEVWPRIKSSHARLSDLSILLFFFFCSFS